MGPTIWTNTKATFTTSFFTPISNPSSIKFYFLIIPSVFPSPQCPLLSLQLQSINYFLASSVQFSHSVMSNFVTHGLQHARTPSLSITSSRSLLKLMSIELVMPSSHLILCLLLLLPSILPSIRVFSNESVLPIRWPKYWSFSFSISSSNECSGLISFRIDWFDLLAVQGTLKRLLQHHSSKASILWRSAVFIVQLSHPYMTTGKTIALTIQTFFSKVSDGFAF